MGAAAAAVASLLMKMIWKIQQKIPKLSESHDEYDRDENGTNGEAEFFFPHTGYDEVVGLCSLLMRRNCGIVWIKEDICNR
nr:hypothetical protein CFP56_25388 [Quercus suber]